MAPEQGCRSSRLRSQHQRACWWPGGGEAATRLQAHTSSPKSSRGHARPRAWHRNASQDRDRAALSPAGPRLGSCRARRRRPPRRRPAACRRDRRPRAQERVRGRRRHAQPVLLPVGQAPAQPRALLMTPSDVRKASHAQLRHAARPAVRHGGSLALRTQMLPPPHGHTHALPSRPPPRTPSAPAAVLAGQPARQQAGEGAVRGRHAARLVPGRRARAA